MEHPVLELFHPLIRQWFTARFGRPTDVQAQAWPRIARGEHLLVTAPTGSGKTLAAFLWALQKLITGQWPGGQTRVLYVSPLKALNNDVQRNLLQPLRELRACFAQAGSPFPALRVLTRSGDTPPGERRQMLRRPPEILITTPESLNLLLSSRGGRLLLGALETVILDEIHAVLGGKRGTHLITAVDRLVPLAGEFQRLALSATVRPLEAAAAFTGGYIARRDGGAWRYGPRPVGIVQSADPRRHRLAVETIEPGGEAPEQDRLWQALSATLLEEIRRSRSTLVFCNSRRLVEKLTRLVNDAAGETLVYSHHGSLARELRLAVEQKLKNGELKGIVATSSLELGIDIGALEKVLLVQAPPSLAAALQRLGRAGHGAGRESRGVLYAVCGRDLVEAAALSRCLPAGEIEPTVPVEAPLDVLAQVLLSMTAVETWEVDELYAFLRTSYPYRRLPRRSFDLLLEMLAGRYASARLRELEPRVYLDRLAGTVRAREGAARLVWLSGGTIPDRGYYDLRLAGSGTKIGELDEEFVWERSVGDTFMLGGGTWRVVRITPGDVDVVPGDRTVNIIPFWRAEEQNRPFFLAEKIGLFLEEADRDPEAAPGEGWSAAAAQRLAAYLVRQKEATGRPLPHRHHLLIEQLHEPGAMEDDRPVILHTLWGGAVNRPFALALAAAWERRFGRPPEYYVSDDGVMLIVPRGLPLPEDLLTLFTPENLEELLRGKLAGSGYFGARFRENAGTALLLPRAGFKKRMPLWLNRLKAKKLLAAVASRGDFPIVLETWRTCLKDDFDLEALKRLLEEIAAGVIAVSEAVTNRPSPFAADLLRRRTGLYMYDDDTPLPGRAAAPERSLLQELLRSPKLRPALPEALLADLDDKLKRTAPGYAPAGSEELLLWIKERLFIPAGEAEALFDAMERDHGAVAGEIKRSLEGRAAWLHPPGAEQPGLCALEMLPRLAAALGLDLSALELRPLAAAGAGAGALAEGLAALKALAEKEKAAEREDPEGGTALLVGQWLSYYGPVPRDFAGRTLGLPEKTAAAALETLLAEEQLVADLFTAGAAEAELCDRENLERLLAAARRARRPAFEPLPARALPLFLAACQGVVPPGRSLEDLQERFDRLFGYPARAQLWEEAILPARMERYHCAWTDSLLQNSDLLWCGRGKMRVTFCFGEDLVLFPPGTAEGEDEGGNGYARAQSLFPDPWGRYDFFALAAHTGLPGEVLADRLWRHLWRGEVAGDSLAVLRGGLLNRFTPVKVESAGRRPGLRTGFKRWAASRPLQGSWYLLPRGAAAGDPLEQEELVKERIRQLFSRYGFLCRELLRCELPALQWRQIFRTLRLMELSGEIYAGHFFAGIPGPQFVSPEGYRLLRRGLDEDSVFWLNAADPASPCGLKLPGQDEDLPARLPGNYVVFHGFNLVVAAGRNGRELLIKTEPGGPALPAYFSFCRALLEREFNPLKYIAVEKINGRPALESPFRPALEEIGFTAGYRSLELHRRYQ